MRCNFLGGIALRRKCNVSGGIVLRYGSCNVSGGTVLRCGLLETFCGLYVCKGSTAMTELVGFNDDDLCDWSDDGGPKLAQMSKQNPFLAEDGTVRPVADRKDADGRPVGMLSVELVGNFRDYRVF